MLEDGPKQPLDSFMKSESTVMQRWQESTANNPYEEVFSGQTSSQRYQGTERFESRANWDTSGFDVPQNERCHVVSLQTEVAPTNARDMLNEDYGNQRELNSLYLSKGPNESDQLKRTESGQS